MSSSTDRLPPMERRSWEDRLAARAPRAYRLAARLTWQIFRTLPPGHRIRLAIMRRTIRRIFGLFNRKDLEVIAAIYHPACRWDWSRFENWPEEPFADGPEALVEAFRVFSEVWDGFIAEPVELLDFGDHQLVTCRLRAQGAGSGVGVERTWWQVGRLLDGLIVSVGNYTDRADALSAARGDAGGRD